MIALALAGALAASAAVETYVVDAGRTEIWFDGRATQSDFEGYGGEPSGWIAVDRADVGGTGRAEIRVDARGMRTREANPTGWINRLFTSLPRTLETDRHPDLLFRLQSLQNVEGTDDGFRAVAVGLLRLRGVWRPVTSVARVRFEGDRLVADGDFPVLMSSWGIRPPRLMLGMLRVEDEVRVRFRVEAVRGGA